MAAGYWKPTKAEMARTPPLNLKKALEVLKTVSARRAQTSHGKFSFLKKKKNIQRKVPARGNISLTKNYSKVKKEPSENNITASENNTTASENNTTASENNTTASENNTTASPSPAKKRKTTGGKRGRPGNPLWYWNYAKVQKKGKKTGADNSLYKNYLKEQMLKAAKKWEGVEPGHGRSCKRK